MCSASLQTRVRFRRGRELWSEDHPKIKEQGDYNLKYLVAAALLDDQVGACSIGKSDAFRHQNAQALLHARRSSS